MKIILFVLLLLFSTFQVHLQNQDRKKKHEELITLGMIASAVSTAVAITTKLQSMFSVTCGQGYRRGVNVIVGNMLSHPITDLGHYQDSGRVLTYGQPIIKGKEFSKYYFVKKFGATGATGVSTWKLNNRDFLLIFYENPWRQWNFQGACIYLDQDLPQEKYETLSRQTLRSYYKQLQNDKQNWPSNCVLLDNTESKDTNWYEVEEFNYGDYKLELVAKYQYLSETSSSCYTAEITVVVKEG